MELFQRIGARQVCVLEDRQVLLDELKHVVPVGPVERLFTKRSPNTMDEQRELRVESCQRGLSVAVRVVDHVAETEQLAKNTVGGVRAEAVERAQGYKKHFAKKVHGVARAHGLAEVERDPPEIPRPREVRAPERQFSSSSGRHGVTRAGQDVARNAHVNHVVRIMQALEGLVEIGRENALLFSHAVLSAAFLEGALMLWVSQESLAGSSDFLVVAARHRHDGSATLAFGAIVDLALELLQDRVHQEVGLLAAPQQLVVPQIELEIDAVSLHNEARPASSVCLVAQVATVIVLLDGVPEYEP